MWVSIKKITGEFSLSGYFISMKMHLSGKIR